MLQRNGVLALETGRRRREDRQLPEVGTGGAHEYSLDGQRAEVPLAIEEEREKAAAE